MLDAIDTNDDFSVCQAGASFAAPAKETTIATRALDALSEAKNNVKKILTDRVTIVMGKAAALKAHIIQNYFDNQAQAAKVEAEAKKSH